MSENEFDTDAGLIEGLVRATRPHGVKGSLLKDPEMTGEVRKRYLSILKERQEREMPKRPQGEKRQKGTRYPCTRHPGEMTFTSDPYSCKLCIKERKLARTEGTKVMPENNQPEQGVQSVAVAAPLENAAKATDPMVPAKHETSKLTLDLELKFSGATAILLGTLIEAAMVYPEHRKVYEAEIGRLVVKAKTQAVKA